MRSGHLNREQMAVSAWKYKSKINIKVNIWLASVNLGSVCVCVYARAFCVSLSLVDSVNRPQSLWQDKKVDWMTKGINNKKKNFKTKYHEVVFFSPQKKVNA